VNVNNTVVTACSVIEVYKRLEELPGVGQESLVNCEDGRNHGEDGKGILRTAGR
jgi:hypothetical protein